MCCWLIAVVAGAIALLRDRPGAGLLLLGATVPAVRYVRMDGVFACVVVVVGGYVIAQVLPQVASWIKQPRVRSIVATSLAGLLVLLALVRCFDLVTNRYYLRTVEESTFGAGLGWWFPATSGGLHRARTASWRSVQHLYLGRLSELAARARTAAIILMAAAYRLDWSALSGKSSCGRAAPDSDLWQQEVSRYNINTVILPIARYQGNQFIRLPDFCSSKIWALVYMDEVSAVFVRRSSGERSADRAFSADLCDRAFTRASAGQQSSRGL